MKAAASKALRAIAVSAAAAALTAAAVFLVSYLTYPVNEVRVENARMLPESEVRESIPERASLLTLNTRLLEREIKSNSWVKSIEVTRDWESGMVTVEVEERRAVVETRQEGRVVYVAVDGTRLPGSGEADLRTVNVGERRLEGILEAVRTLQENGLTVGSVEEAGPGGVEVIVERREVVFSGSISGEQARALGEIMEQRPEAARFDLRSPRRVVVPAGGGGGSTSG